MSALLRVDDLRKLYPGRSGLLRRRRVAVPAVDGVSFDLAEGETLGLVGESGCGKSTLARLVLRLIEPSSGRIEFSGRDVTSARGADLRTFRRETQIVFQDPYASLNPRMSAGAIVGEPLRIHRVGAERELPDRALALLERVGLSGAHASRYPHQLSGGERQRVAIARALALEPRLIVCDEPVSALDVSVQAQVINLLASLQSELGLACLFIAHDLAVVRHVSDRIAVMYLGRIVEVARCDSLYGAPHHPYTEALLSAVPSFDAALAGRSGEHGRIVLRGEPQAVDESASGCRFRTRCPLADALCAEHEPPLSSVADGHFAACHFARAYPVTSPATHAS